MPAGAGMRRLKDQLAAADRFLTMVGVRDAADTSPRNSRSGRAAVLGRADSHAVRRQVIDFLEHHAHQSRPTALDRVLRARTRPV